jgi:hypothetical protein
VIAALLVADWLLTRVMLLAYCRIALPFLPLRPLYLVLSSVGLSSAVVSICGVLCTRGMRSVTVFYFLFWVLAAMMATTMLRTQGNGVHTDTASCMSPPPPRPPPGALVLPKPPPPPPPSPRPDSHDTQLNAFSFTSFSFDEIAPSMISVFILITTGENYADVVSRPFFCFDLLQDGFNGVPPRAALVLIFFFALSITSLVFVVGTFVGVFQDGFLRQRHAQRTQVKLFERVGAIAAFSMLDVSTRGQVSRSEFESFLEYLERNERVTFVLSPVEVRPTRLCWSAAAHGPPAERGAPGACAPAACMVALIVWRLAHIAPCVHSSSG